MAAESRAHPEWLAEALALFEQRFGHDVPARQFELFRDAIEQATASFGLASAASCVSMLRTQPLDAPLVQNVLSALTNKESYFFRDASTVQSLREEILPALFARAQSTRVLRIWSAGCSTGEELYTIAILLHELLPNLDDWTVSLVGSDVDYAAITRALRAEYKPWSLRATEQPLRKRYFDELASGAFRLKQRYRSNACFHVHNLADPGSLVPAPGRFDLIFCRNVTIYFSLKAQGVVADKLREALADGGLWLAGPSDPMPRAGFATRVLPGLIAHGTDTHARASGVIAHDTAAHGRMSTSARLASPLPPRSFDSSSALDHSSPLPWAPVANPAPAPLAPSAATKPATTPVPPRAAHKPESAPPKRSLSDDLEQVRTLADGGQARLALTRAEELIARHPLAAEPYFLRAVVRDSLQQSEQACEDLRRVLYLNPQHVEAGLRLGLLLERLGERAAACSALRAVAAMQAGADGESDALRTVAAQHLVRLIKVDDHG